MRRVMWLLAFVGLQASVQAASCLPTEPTLTVGQVSGRGTHAQESVAIARAQEAVAMQIDSSRLSTQFIQKSTYAKNGSQSSRQSNSSVQQRVNIDTHRARYFKAYCQGQHHVVLVYDLRSLSARIAAQLNDGRRRPVGPDYLTQSRLLNTYQYFDGSPIAVSLVAAEQKVFLQLGGERYGLQLDDLQEAVAWPVNAVQPVEPNHTQLTLGTTAEVQLRLAEPSQLYLCDQSFSCAWLAHQTPTQSRASLVPVSAGETALAYLIVLPDALESVRQRLAINPASADFLVFMLDQLSNTEQRPYWQTLYIPRNFQRNTVLE